MYKELWDKANEAGKIAAQNCQVKGMIVYEADLFSNKPLPDGNAWHVPEGVCGFAWLDIRPASPSGRKDCDLVKYLRTNHIGSYDDYAKSWHYAIQDYNQSMQRKEAHAEAMAKVLQDNGIRAYANSRLD